tara:strand:- start:1318 stop:1503 length:186 start_codon:yes stop_codon:yes gene_type:complete
MKTFKVEIDEVTTYVGTIQAETIEDAKDAIAKADIVALKNVEPVIGETKIQFIEEQKNDKS